MFPPALCDVQSCHAKDGNDLVAPCGRTKVCCDLDKVETCTTPTSFAGSDSSSSSSKTGASLAIIVPVVVAAVLLVAAVLFLVRKRAVAARQPHRDASMPNVGDGDEAEVEA